MLHLGGGCLVVCRALCRAPYGGMRIFPDFNCRPDLATRAYVKADAFCKNAQEAADLVKKILEVK